MANGQVEIHDPFAEPVSSPDRGPEPPSDSDSMEPTVEFRVLMAYAKRRRPQKVAPSEEAEAPSAHKPDQTETEQQQQQQQPRRRKKKKMRMKRWTRSIFSCIKPQTEDKEQSRGSSPPDVHDRCAPRKGAAEVEEVEEEEEELNEVAERLTKMADEIPFVRPDLETDSVEEDETVEKLIGVLLRDAGDKMNEAELKDLTIKLSWDYGLFKLLMSTFLTRMGLRSPHPDSPGPKASPKTQIAVACEVTSRLVGFNPLPRNRLLDHGARYLQHYYSPWAQQHGGYEEAFYSDDEDDGQ